MIARWRQAKARQVSSRPQHDRVERSREKRSAEVGQTEADIPQAAPKTEHSTVSEPAKEKRRSFIKVAGIAIPITAAIISAVSAYISIRSYQSQQDASKQAMADQVVIVAPPMSPAQLEQLKQQHPLDFYNYFPMYVQNYGRLPVLGLIAKARVNGKIEGSQIIGTLLPCTQVQVDGVLRAAMSTGHGQEKWTVIVSFEDVSGQTWERSLAGSPWPVKNQGFALQIGVGMATSRVKDCAAA